MGWFSSDPTPKPEPNSTDDGNYRPMKRDDRKKCWEARDRYFSCLDRKQILDPLKNKNEAASQCSRESQAFDQDCAKSWIEYFKQKRVADYEKEQKIRKLEDEGAIPVQQAGKPGWKIW